MSFIFSCSKPKSENNFSITDGKFASVTKTRDKVVLVIIVEIVDAHKGKQRRQSVN